MKEKIPKQGSGSVKLESGGSFPVYSAKSEFNSEIEEGTEVIVVNSEGGSVISVRELEKEEL